MRPKPHPYFNFKIFGLKSVSDFAAWFLIQPFWFPNFESLNRWWPFWFPAFRQSLHSLKIVSNTTSDVNQRNIAGCWPWSCRKLQKCEGLQKGTASRKARGRLVEASEYRAHPLCYEINLRQTKFKWVAQGSRKTSRHVQRYQKFQDSLGRGKARPECKRANLHSGQWVEMYIPGLGSLKITGVARVDAAWTILLRAIFVPFCTSYIPISPSYVPISPSFVPINPSFVPINPSYASLVQVTPLVQECEEFRFDFSCCPVSPSSVLINPSLTNPSYIPMGQSYAQPIIPFVLHEHTVTRASMHNLNSVRVPGKYGHQSIHAPNHNFVRIFTCI